MKAIILTEPGSTDKLKLTNLEIPTIQPYEVLVKVRAASINPVDIKTRLGLAMHPRIKEDQPIILGWDVSGEVISVGARVTGFQVGDEVFGMVNFPGHGKAYAEFVAVPESHLASKPDNVTHPEAAACTLAALTAWQVLVTTAQIMPGHRVLIHAAAGGVGHFAVQIAKHFGAYVIGTASAANATFLTDLGTDEHLDYAAQAFEEKLENIDIVLDPLGGEVTWRSLAVLKPGGHLISIVGGVKEEIAQAASRTGIKVDNYLVQSSGSDMEKLAALLESGKIKPFVSQQFKLEEVAQAHQQIQTGKTRGKIVLTFD